MTIYKNTKLDQVVTSNTSNSVDIRISKQVLDDSIQPVKVLANEFHRLSIPVVSIANIDPRIALTDLNQVLVAEGYPELPQADIDKIVSLCQILAS